MSVEIEVGLENAAKVRIPAGQNVQQEEKPRATAVSSKLRTRLILGGVILLRLSLRIASLLTTTANLRTTPRWTDTSLRSPQKFPVAFGKSWCKTTRQVKAGELLVQIDPGDYQAALDQAKGGVGAGRRRSAFRRFRRAAHEWRCCQRNLQRRTRNLLGRRLICMRAQATYEQSQTADLAFAQANVEKSRANAQLAQADLARYGPLMEKGEISKQQYDAAKANADASASALHADEQRLAQAQRNIEICRAQLDASKARVDQAQAGVATANADINRVGMRSADAQAKLAKVDQARASGGSRAAESQLLQHRRARGWRRHPQAS